MMNDYIIQYCQTSHNFPKVMQLPQKNIGSNQGCGVGSVIIWLQAISIIRLPAPTPDRPRPQLY